MNKSDLDQIQKIIGNAIKSLPTKEDLKSFATKDDLKNLATKDDLKQFATKNDLQVLKKELIEKMDEYQMELLEIVEKRKADKTDVEVLEKHIKNIEDMLHTQ